MALGSSMMYHYQLKGDCRIWGLGVFKQYSPYHVLVAPTSPESVNGSMF